MRHLALYHGVIPFALTFDPDSFEDTTDAALRLLVARGHLAKGRLVAIVQSGRTPIWRKRHQHAIQARRARGGAGDDKLGKALGAGRAVAQRALPRAGPSLEHATLAPPDPRTPLPPPSLQVRRVEKRHLAPSPEGDSSIEDL